MDEHHRGRARGFTPAPGGSGEPEYEAAAEAFADTASQLGEIIEALQKRNAELKEDDDV